MRAGELHAVVADHVFDGTKRHQHAAVLIRGARVTRIVSRSEIPGNLPVRILPDGVWLVPGFIDLQVNGGGDVLFNDAPTPEAISVIAAAHRSIALDPLRLGPACLYLRNVGRCGAACPRKSRNR
jgi:N-acetylglucosamine-6-phosphate deacetylase